MNQPFAFDARKLMGPEPRACPKKMLGVFDENMLQLFEFERFLFDSVMPHDRETL
jgi:hypothetical protein